MGWWCGQCEGPCSFPSWPSWPDGPFWKSGCMAGDPHTTLWVVDVPHGHQSHVSWVPIPAPMLELFYYFFLLFLIVCMWGRVAHTHDTMHMWRVKGILWESVLSHQVSSRDWTQVARLGSKHPYLPSRLSSPQVCFKCGCSVIQGCLQNPSPLHVLRRVSYSWGTTEGFHCQSPVASLGIYM